MNDAMPPSPKLFISYSWSSQTHQQRVLDLAEDLSRHGIHVVIDKWDLQPGHDAYAFMEQMVSDPSVSKVLLICDKTYEGKTNAREGGAGAEAQIITPEIYNRKTQDKYAAVVFEKDQEGRPYLPAFYGGRIFIDLCDDLNGTEFDKLVRWIWDKPLHIRPALGPAPQFMIEQTNTPRIATSNIYRRAIDAIRTGHATAIPAATEYLDTLASGFENFRISASNQSVNTFDDIVINSISDFLPYRNEATSVFYAIAGYLHGGESTTALHRFFERLIPYTMNQEHVNQYYEVDYDNMRFLIQELFLCCIAAFIKREQFDSAAPLLHDDYYISNRRFNGKMVSYSIFRHYSRALEGRNQRLGLNRISLKADLIKERSEGNTVDFEAIMGNCSAPSL